MYWMVGQCLKGRHYRVELPDAASQLNAKKSHGMSSQMPVNLHRAPLFASALQVLRSKHDFTIKM
jgi:hypothetical protein